ncbi:hypothetical protein ACJX0J_009346, partial [Zea mays]
QFYKYFYCFMFMLDNVDANILYIDIALILAKIYLEKIQQQLNGSSKIYVGTIVNKNSIATSIDNANLTQAQMGNTFYKDIRIFSSAIMIITFTNISLLLRIYM